MKIAGSSRKDGMTLYGPHYKVNITVKEPDQEPVIEVKEHKSGVGVTKTTGVPLLRGIASLVINNGPIAAAMGVELLTEIQEARGKKHRILNLLNLGLSAFLLYRIAGNVGELRKFHGAEHKVIGAQEKGLPIDMEHVKEVSRVSDRCGTNFIGFYLPAQFLCALLPIKSQTVKALLGMGLAYEGFKLDRAKYGKYVNLFYTLGGKAQEYITTAEPEDKHLSAAIAGMEALLNAEAQFAEQ